MLRQCTTVGACSGFKVMAGRELHLSEGAVVMCTGCTLTDTRPPLVVYVST